MRGVWRWREIGNRRGGDTLFSQYRLYVETAEKAAERRNAANRFYVSVCSGLFALFSMLADRGFMEIHLLMVMAGGLGVLLSVLWHANIVSFKQLSSGKYRVIEEMERRLPYACFSREWEYLGGGRRRGRYLPVTVVESCIPILFGVLFMVMLVWGASLLGG